MINPVDESIELNKEKMLFLLEMLIFIILTAQSPNETKGTKGYRMRLFTSVYLCNFSTGV